MTYIPSYYLKDVIGDEAYEKLLEFGNGCMLYVSKKENENVSNKKEYKRLINSGLSPNEAIKILSQNIDLTVRTVRKYHQKGLFDD